MVLEQHRRSPTLLNGVSEHDDGKARTFGLADSVRRPIVTMRMALAGGLRDTLEFREGSDLAG